MVGHRLHAAETDDRVENTGIEAEIKNDTVIEAS